MTRPGLLVAVAGTGTDVGKTWLAAALARARRARGCSVVASKPVQSFEDGAPEPTDADVLADATGQDPSAVCPPHRWYPVPMAPPMAADVLGRPPPALDELVAETTWPATPVDVGILETVGGVRSPVSVDGDSRDLIRRIHPDVVVLVADAGLGTIDAVRLASGALEPWPVVVYLNRYDPGDDLHRRNLDWLLDRDGITAVHRVDDLDAHLGRHLDGHPDEDRAVSRRR